MRRKAHSVKPLPLNYTLGERNPDTLPGTPGSESKYDNETKSRHWRSLRKLVQANRLIGAKY